MHSEGWLLPLLALPLLPLPLPLRHRRRSSDAPTAAGVHVAGRWAAER